MKKFLLTILSMVFICGYGFMNVPVVSASDSASLNLVKK